MLPGRIQESSVPLPVGAPRHIPAHCHYTHWEPRSTRVPRRLGEEELRNRDFRFRGGVRGTGRMSGGQ